MDHQIGNAQEADGGPQARYDGVESRGFSGGGRRIPAWLARGGGVAASVESLDEGVDERT